MTGGFIGSFCIPLLYRIQEKSFNMLKFLVKLRRTCMAIPKFERSTLLPEDIDHLDFQAHWYSRERNSRAFYAPQMIPASDQQIDRENDRIHFMTYLASQNMAE